GYTASANASGILTIPNLGIGAYSNFQVTNNVTLCSGLVIIDSVELVYPNFNVTNTTNTNPSACGASNGSISFSGLPANTAFQGTYSYNGSSAVSYSATTNAFGVYVITGLAAGSYTNFTFVNASGTCSANPFLGPIVLVDPNAPNPTGIVSITNPTACNTSNGRFTIAGLTPGQYTVEYESPTGTVFYPVSGFVTVSASGNLTINGLDNGVYSNIIVQNAAGCSSIPLGPVTLVDPIVNLGDAGANDTICLTTSAALTIAPQVANLTVTWRNIDFSIITILGPANFPSYTHLVSPLNNTCYIAEIFDNTTGCSELDTVCVYVSKAPELNLEANCFSLDEDSDITLSIINDIYANDNMSNIYGPGDLNANLDITILSNVQHGVLSINEALDQIVYTPYANYFGTDTLFYQVCNADCAGALFCDDAYLCFNVLEVNDAPIAVIDFNNTTIGNAVTGNVLTNDYDVEGDALTATLISSANGTYGSITSFSPNGDYIYTPSGTEGTDVFTYQVCDDGSPILCDTNIIVINVIDYVVQHNTNNAPIANPDGMIALQGTPVVSNVMANDFDPDSDDTISVTSFTQPLVGTGTVSISPQGQMTYTPPVSNPNFTGLVEFTYVICDNGNPSPVLCDTALVQIEVLPLGDPSLNNPPTAVDDAISTGQDTPANGNLAANDFDVDGDQLSFSILGGTTTSAGGTISGFNPTTGTFTYTPAQGYEGPDGFLYSVCDNGSPVLCDTATVVITVIYDNNAPIAIDDINNGFMNTSVLGNVATNDSEPDGDEVVFTIISPASSGTLTLDSVTGAYVYTPVLGFEGADEFSYSICDDANPSLCDTATVSINIENIVDGPFTNNEPIASNDNTVTYGTNPVYGNVLSNDFDSDGDNLVLNTTPLSASAVGTFSLSPNGNFSYIPVPGFEGIVEFVYQVCDDGIPSLCDTASVIIEVFPPLNPGENEGPFAVDDAYGTDNETSISANVLVNDVLPNDGDVHTVILVSSVDPAAGTLTLDNLGNFVFTPATDVETTTSFVYALCDDATPIACDTATAVIMIWDANVPPVAVNDFNNTLIGVPVSGDVSTNDFDANNDVLVFTQVGNIPSSEGSLVINPDGTYVFTPASGFVGQVEATYVVCDDNTTNFIADNACDTASLVINVVELNSPNGDNNSPVANDDNIVVTSLNPITSNVLANDFDVDGDSLIINTTPLSGPSAGTLVINTDGSFVFTPQADTTGIFTFEYSICDNGVPSLCDTATVTITVLEPLDSTENQAPFAVDDAFAGLANELVNGNVYANDINPDGDPLVMDTLSQPSNGTITFFDPLTGDFTYVPNDDYVGPDAFTYSLCDNGTPVLCSQATVEILIYNNNNAPVAVDDINATIVNVAVSGDVSTNDFDPNTNDVLSFAILDNNGNNVVMDSTGVYTFTPLPGDTGSFSFTYYVCDDVNPSLCDTATVVINVDGFIADPNENNEPIANNDNLATYGTSTVVINAIANDYDPDLTDVIAITGIIPSTQSPGITVIDNGNGSFTVTPDVDTLAQYSFDYVLCDNANPSLCDTATVSIIVLPLNNPNANLGPIAIDDVFAIGDNEILSANVGTNDINPDTDPLSFSVLDSTSNGVITSFDPVTGSFTYLPNPDYAGPDNFTYVVCDTLANCDSATVYIVVYPNNEYPIAVNDINLSYLNTPVSGDVSTNDIDPDSDPLVFAVVDQSNLNGTLVFAADGTYTFVPTTDFEGQTSFTYSTCDDGTPSLCDTATVVINIESFDASDNANNNPVANDDNIVVTSDSPLVVCVVCNDFDIDGDSIYVSSIINPNGYNVVNNGNGSFTVSPPAGVNDTTITVDYVLCDNGTPIACDTATLTIDIVPSTGDFNNIAPFAVDDAYGTVIGEVISANVAANDILPNDGDTHSFAVVNNPNNGTITSFDPATGAFTYVPDSAYFGPDNFTYVVCDNGTPMACDTATVLILIYNDNDYPNAVDDINVTLVGTPVNGDVSTNDTDPDNDVLSFDNVTNPSNGTLVFNPDGTYTYTPAPGFDGQDEFTYVVCDDGIPSLCDTATVVINVEGFDPNNNNDPVANDDNVQTHADVPVTLCLICNDFDVDGDDITVTSIINPDGYNVIDNGDGTVTITPPAGVEDTTITIQYVICDNGNPVACDTASVNVEVLPALEPGENEGPFAVDDAYSTVTDGSISANVSNNDILPNDGDTHSFTVVNDPSNGTITSFDPATGAFTYVPDSGYYGPDNFTYVVCDSGNPVECDTATVVILIYNDNHNPIAVDDINVTLVGIPVSGDVSTNDTDPDGNNLSFDNVTNPSNGTLVFNPDGTYTYTPAPGFDGQDEFTYVVCDDGIPSLCDTATVVINVEGFDPTENNDPVANDDNVQTHADVPVTLCLICNDFDVDGDDITVTSIINPDGYNVVDNGDGTVTITPPAGVEDTTITIQYVICDDGNPVACDTASVNVEVLPALEPGENEGPFAVDDAYGVPANESVVANVADNDILPADGDVHSFTQITEPSNGVVTSFDPVTGAFTYEPNQDYAGPDQFTYVVCDNGVPMECDTATVYILMYNINTAPIAVNDVNHTFNDLPVSGDVSTNDIEPDKDPVTFTLVEDVDPTTGTLVFNSDGTYTFTPEPGFEGTVTFSYSICDVPGNLCDTATVVIDVDQYNPNTNNDPIAVDDNVIVFGDPSNPVGTVICILCNDSDPDGDVVTTTIISGPNNGTFTPNPDGTYTYTPNPGFTGDDVIVYVNCDGFGLCDTATVTITVLPNPGNNVNHQPFAVDDHYSTNQDVAITTENVTDNDVDFDNDNLTVSLIDGPSFGSLTQNPDGSFVYTPNVGFAGEDQYTYVICDDGNPVLCDSATVYITVFSDAVDAVNDTVQLLNNDPVDVVVLNNDSYSTGSPSVTILTDPVAGSAVVNVDGTITYYPNPDAGVEVDSFQYVLCANTICDTAWVYIYMPEQIVVPDGFSPQGDGVNDVFYIDGLLDYYPNATLVVFNRWGDEVWNSYGPYQNNWGGDNFQNVGLPDGTYFYILDFKDGSTEAKQGFVAIYRNR
ncbi:MAG: tandem-95 repeat protein, partial [Chitinophagales bacterium]|nr:tandem-95 repeat protein [Chitinophagales bacterium]